MNARTNTSGRDSSNIARQSYRRQKQSGKQKKKGDESYKEKLTETDWPLFNVLREWRAGRSKEEGIPPYVICTNLQLRKLNH